MSAYSLRPGPLLVLGLLAGPLAAMDHNWVITVPAVLPGDPSRDLEIELARRGDGFLPQGWVGQTYSHGVGGARVVRQHFGDDATVLEVEVTILGDPWFPGWSAELRMEFPPGGDGRATGRARVEGRDAVWSEVVVGVGVRQTPAWPEPVDPPVAGHPRLILRRSDLPALRERMTGPEGKSMMERLHAAAALRYPDGHGKASRFRTWPAVAAGVLRHLADDAAWADRARAGVEAALGDDGGQDIHMAPRLVGLALAYDLCGSDWDEGFRARVAEDLRRRMRALDLTGGFPNAANLASLSNHNGIRLGSLGIAALALLGDGPDPALERSLADVQRRIRHHLEAGYGETGMYLEGGYYKGMTLERALGPFLWSHRQALGSRVEGGGFADWFLLGQEVMAAAPGDLAGGSRGYDGGGLSPSVALVFGGATVRPDHRPVLRGLLDRLLSAPPPAIGPDAPEGEAMVACYLPVAFPWESAPQPPRDILPAILVDRRYGRHLVRPAHGSAVDPLLVLHTKTGLIRGGHERGGWNAGLEIASAAGPLLDGSWLPTIKEKPSATNPTLGGEGIALRPDGGRRLVQEIVLDRAFLQHPVSAWQALQAAGRGQGVLGDRSDARAVQDLHRSGDLARRLLPVAGARAAVEVPGWGWWIDHGVRGRRTLAVDASGPGGTPLVAVIRDRLWIEGEEAPPRWTLEVPLAARDREPVVAGTRFEVGQGPGRLVGWVIGEEAGVQATSTTRVRGVVEPGRPPRRVEETTWSLALAARGTLTTVLVVAGEDDPDLGMEAGRISIGRTVLRMDGDRLVWE